MPNTREKLIKLLKKAKAKEQCDFLFGDIDTAIDMPYGAEYYANYLIANGVTVQEWISVKDRLPEKIGEHILVCYSDGWICDQYTPVDDGVTHWMPLPQPPKGE